MKKFNLSLVAVLAMSTFAVAGGDIAPVEPVVETPYVEESTGAFYLGAAYGLLKSDSNFFDASVDDQSFDINSDYDALMLQAGYKFNSYVAVEGRYWFGGSETIAHVPDSAGIGRDVDIDIDSWGIYVKPMYPVSDAFDIYALLGYADNGYELSAITVKGDVSLNPDADIDGFSWGIGAAYSFNENMSVFVDYTVLYDDETDWHADLVVEDVIDTINFGVTYQF